MPAVSKWRPETAGADGHGLGGGTALSQLNRDADGNKKFLFGGAIAGCFHRIPGTDDVVAVAEGYATAASIHRATGWTVLTAFNAGNLLPVARAWRDVHPGCRLVVCGDDDRWAPTGNVGRAKAEACAGEIGGTALFPSFAEDEGRPTDWNDLHQREGLEEVKRQLLAGAEQRQPNIRSWGLDRFAGKSPGAALAENIMPCGAVFVLAAMGDARRGSADPGPDLKSRARLLYARTAGVMRGISIRIWRPSATGFCGRGRRRLFPPRTAPTRCTAVSEHRRGPARRCVLPLPNAGGPLPSSPANMAEPSADWLEPRAQLQGTAACAHRH